MKKIFDEKIKVYNAESKKCASLQQNNTELSTKIFVLEKNIAKNKEETNAEKEKPVKLVKSLQDDLSASESNFTSFLTRGRDIEKRNIKHSKQVSDFE